MRIVPFRSVASLFLVILLGLAGCRKDEPHVVTLTWEAPHGVSADSIVGYNIYRGTTAGGPYALLAVRVSGPPYQDHLVVSGRTYFYVATAIDRAGRQSKYSNETRAEIP